MEEQNKPLQILFSRYLLGLVLKHNNRIALDQLKEESVNNIFTLAFFFVSYYLLLYTGIIHETEESDGKYINIVDDYITEVQKQTDNLTVHDLEETLLWNSEDKLLDFCSKYEIPNPGKKKITLIKSIMASNVDLRIILSELADDDMIHILSSAAKISGSKDPLENMVKIICDKTLCF